MAADMQCTGGCGRVPEKDRSGHYWWKGLCPTCSDDLKRGRAQRERELRGLEPCDVSADLLGLGTREAAGVVQTALRTFLMETADPIELGRAGVCKGIGACGPISGRGTRTVRVAMTPAAQAALRQLGEAVALQMEHERLAGERTGRAHLEFLMRGEYSGERFAELEAVNAAKLAGIRAKLGKS